jgi:hypothetical protein
MAFHGLPIGRRRNLQLCSSERYERFCQETRQCDLILTTVDGGGPMDVVQSVQIIQLWNIIKLI